MKTVENTEPVDPLLYDIKAQLVMVLVVQPREYSCGNVLLVIYMFPVTKGRNFL